MSGAVEVEMSDDHLSTALSPSPPARREGAAGSFSDDEADDGGDLLPYPPSRGSFFSRNKTPLLVLSICLLALLVLLVAFSSSAAGGGGGGGGQFENGPWAESVRLPHGIVPRSYDISIHPDLQAFTFDGNASLFFDVVSPGLRHVILHAASPLAVTAWELLGADGERVELKEPFAYEPHEFFVLPLQGSRRLEPGVAYELRLAFAGDLTDSLAGLYRSHYVDRSGADHYIATTQFEPTDARRAFPCFDEPALKANFSVALVRPAGDGWTALSNMPAVPGGGEPYPGGGVLQRFQTSPLMSTYLVCMIVCDFAHIEGATSEGTPVRVWTPADEIEEARFALSVAERVLPVYDRFYDYPFPLPKLDMVAIPDFAAGAMENWGLVTYRQVDLLYDNRTSSTAARQRVAVVVAHELAHMITGDLVTLQWWQFLYANEGYAAFMEHYGVHALYPEWRMWDQFRTGTQRGALALDSLRSSHPIEVDVEDPAAINEIFDTISYSKGASVILMMQQFVGEDVFQDGMRAYVREHAFGNVVSADLWDAMTAAVARAGAGGPASGVDVRRVMERWTQQQGYPLLTVHADGSVTQRQFLLDNGTAAAGDQVWDVPAAYSTRATANGTGRLLWAGPETASAAAGATLPASALAEAETGWLRLNAGQWGFYRVEYDEAMWPAVLAAVRAGDASAMLPLDRAGTLDDAFNLARAGLLDYGRAIEASLGLRADSSYAVWSATASHLGFLRERLQLEPFYGLMEQHVLGLVGPALERPGVASWDDADMPAGEAGHVPRLMRRLVLAEAARFGHEGTLRQARDAFDVFMRNETEFEARVGPDLRQLVWEYGVQQGGEAEWDRLWAYRQSNERTVTEKRDILVALAYTRVPWLLSRYLHWAIDDTCVRRQDARYPIVGVARNPVGADLAWRFVRDNWSSISTAGLGGGSLVRGVLDGGADLNRALEAEAFFAGAGAGSAERAVRQAVESIEANAEWKRRFMGAVQDTLEGLYGE